MKNFYAIKIGRGVRDKIVTSWEECKKYVLYYNAIFKGFRMKCEAQAWLDDFTDAEIEYRLERQLSFRNKYLKEKILVELNFKISSEMLNFIIENTDDYDKICSYIDISAKNEEISNYKANLLKKYLKDNIMKKVEY